MSIFSDEDATLIDEKLKPWRQGDVVLYGGIVLPHLADLRQALAPTRLILRERELLPAKLASLSVIVHKSSITQEGAPKQHKKEHDIKISIRAKLAEWIAVWARQTAVFAELIRSHPEVAERLTRHEALPLNFLGSR